MNSLDIDPEFKSLIPPLTSLEFEALEQNIISDGCREPLVAWNSTIIDGHNRYEICKSNQIDYAYITKNFNNRNEVMLWMINNQFGRRNISTYVRCELALRLKDFYSEIAKENQAHGETAPGQTLSLNSAEALKPIDAREEISKKANVGHDTMNKVERIKNALNESPDPEIEEKLKTGEVSINHAFQKVVKKNLQVNIYTGNNEWYTPTEHIESARLVMGSIDLDPASNETANKIVKANQFYTLENSGLDQEWGGNVWMNPPYSTNEIRAFIDKLHLEINRCSAAIVLTNNSTDTSWWHKLASFANEICFTRGRINFYNEDNKSSPTNGQTFFYFGNSSAKFYTEFSKYGLVISCPLDC